jgi:hypothetical protein
MIIMPKDLDNLIKKMKSIRKLAEKEIVGIKVDVERIIHEKSNDEEHIEHTLDNLLNLVLMGVGVKEFHELNDFYFTFNPENADDYKIIYKEITEEEY